MNSSDPLSYLLARHILVITCRRFFNNIPNFIAYTTNVPRAVPLYKVTIYYFLDKSLYGQSMDGLADHHYLLFF